MTSILRETATNEYRRSEDDRLTLISATALEVGGIPRRIQMSDARSGATPRNLRVTPPETFQRPSGNKQ